MRKFRLYLSAAVIVGIFIMLVPLFAVAAFVGITSKYGGPMQLVIEGGFRRLEGNSDLAVSQPYTLDFVVLVISFIVAATFYLLIKHGMPNRDYMWTQIPRR